MHNTTHTCIPSGSPGSCLVQEIKVGRSIPESPLTLLPSYSAWNSTSPTEGASHRGRRHPLVVNDHTKKKPWTLVHVCYFLVMDTSIYIFELGQKSFSLQESFWIRSEFHILNVSNNCVASSSTAAALKNNRLSPDTFMQKLHEDWSSSVKSVKCVQTSKMCSYPRCHRIQTGAETISKLINLNNFDHWF